jgi:aldose sugar dehydrogenase
MNKKRISRFVLTILLSGVVITNAVAQESGWKVPSWADTTLSPFTANSAVIKEGREIYATYCTACHGKEGNGKGAPGMTFEVQPANFHDMDVMRQKDGTLFWKITKGYRGMPGFAGSLTENQRWKVIAYLRTFAKGKNGAAAASFEHSLPVSGYSIDQSMTSGYFPVPRKVKNVIGSKTMQFMVDTVVSGLTLPWSVAFLPDKKTMLITERSGKLQIIRNGKIAGVVKGDIPTSLREVKLHPKFESNGYVYLSYYRTGEK